VWGYRRPGRRRKRAGRNPAVSGTRTHLARRSFFI